MVNNEIYRKMKLRLLLVTAFAIVASFTLADNKCTKLYMYGFAASFNDSTVYFTDIQEMDSVWTNTKTGFLYSRDNYSYQLRDHLKKAVEAAKNGQATVFGYYVNDPERFGIVEFDENWRVISVEEKPKQPKSNYAITGLYFYDKRVVELAKQVKPSARGELEITDLNRMYLEDGTLNVQLLGRGYAWLDTGTMDTLVEAAEFVQVIEQRQGIMISAPEEIAYRHGWITREELLKSADTYGKSPYGEHLHRVADGKIRY